MYSRAYAANTHLHNIYRLAPEAALLVASLLALDLALLLMIVL
jgi:hypothetical protein